MTVVDRVRAIVAEALFVSPEDVQPDMSLMRDLGAESIDFLDILFRLEKEFGVSLTKNDIERRAKGSLADSEFAIDGRLTVEALSRLATIMPEVDREALRPGLQVRDIPSLFNVKTFARLVEQQL